MRDILVCLMTLGPLPYALAHPWVGMMVWVFVSLLNPHRYTWGFANGMPLAAAAAAAIFAGIVFTRDERRAPTSAPAIILILLSLWICVTQAFAIFPEPSIPMLSRVLKIYLLTVVAMCVIVTPKQIRSMVWVMTLSILVLSAKGGLFTLLSAGAYRVWGPPESFIEDNNSFALAALMVVPLTIFLAGEIRERHKWWSRVLIGCVPLSILSALGSHSRGALLAMLAMLAFLIAKSRKKFMLIVLVIAAAPAVIAFLPQEWFARMETIETYQQDASAQGRLNSWHMAFNLAKDRITGGGFALANRAVFEMYAPDPTIPLAAHSIYFQVLGEHGFIGLFLFLSLWFVTWRQAKWVARNASSMPELAWMANLASMIQVSLIAYLAGGAFLSMSYWDMPYYEVVVVVAMRRHIMERQAALAREPFAQQIGGTSSIGTTTPTSSQPAA